jgi:hypothetical protein
MDSDLFMIYRYLPAEFVPEEKRREAAAPTVKENPAYSTSHTQTRIEQPAMRAAPISAMPDTPIKELRSSGSSGTGSSGFQPIKFCAFGR